MYSREIDGQILTLSASGWTYQNLFVIFDYQTETMWYDLATTTGLTSISGPFQDRVLQELDSTYGSWQTWKRAHPDTKYLRY